MSEIRVRPATPADAVAMARVHVASWRETYRGAMADAVLDDPEFLARREHFWEVALTDPRYASNRAAVAERNGEIVGIAMSGAASDSAAVLHLIYLLRSAHGSGAGQELLDAVIDPAQAATLWVLDPNPRAQAFYRRNRFAPDGEAREEDGTREIRMSRPAL